MSDRVMGNRGLKVRWSSRVFAVATTVFHALALSLPGWGTRQGVEAHHVSEMTTVPASPGSGRDCMT